MTKAQEADMMMTYHMGRRDALQSLLGAAELTPGMREAITWRIEGNERAIAQWSRSLREFRRLELEAEREQKNWRDRAGPGLRQSFGGSHD